MPLPSLRSLVLVSALSVLVLPAVVANDGAAAAATEHDCNGSYDGMDTLCWHADCGPHGCVYTHCPVYLTHSGHLHPRLFGCTRP